MDSTAATPQPPPVGDDGEIVINWVMADLNARASFGKNKYGTLLKTNNGRDALWDAYQESLDLCMYLRQAILERDREGVQLIADGKEVEFIKEKHNEL